MQREISVLIMGIIALIYGSYLTWFILQQDPGNSKMQEIADAIEQGAKAYLIRQNKTVLVLIIILSLILMFIPGMGRKFVINFITGALLSALAGAIGMLISVKTNVRTANAAKGGLWPAMNLAFKGGTVTGMFVVGLALIGVLVMYLLFVDNSSPDTMRESMKSLITFGVGASLISLFARVGGGIYTKGADVGADLVGKIEAGIPEDDPRNPAVIADNVGDNVGDCAGMAADLFESYSVTLIAAMLLGVEIFSRDGKYAILYPFMLGAIAIIASILGTLFVKTNDKNKIWPALNKGILMSSAFSVLGFFLIQNIFNVHIYYFWSAIVGIVVTVAIGFIVDYYTSAKKKPTQLVAQSAQTGAGTNVIMGLAIGMESTVLPVIIICIGIFVANWLGWKVDGVYGAAYSTSIAAMAMIAMSGIIVSVDSFGPITDNAGGIAEMANLPESVREYTDALDAVGNTTKAVTKGFAIGAAALAALSLFAAYAHDAKIDKINILDANVVIGLFVGGVLTFLFSSLTMRAVGRAATLIVEEVRRQFKEIKGIMEGTAKPDYARCVDISTKAAIKELVLPGILAIFVPLIIGFLLGKEALGGVLAGSIVTGLLMAIMMTTGGGTWDNAKKYIESGYFGGKGSLAHKAAIVGDTVGDPFKDTSGPALNPLIKVVNTVALLAAATGILGTGILGF